ncbi:MAG: tRNA (guanosine(46)-N7)-methyltransferase TrmB, partial [Merismopedia sp. SIO2A8]|nr:tRNA (guanosine(46)-N7)-methyltransferase TrmB [Merismopedia sp. SIO2A8]
MATVRVRQHVNPLGIRFREPITSPDWSAIYSNVSQPLHLDIGSAHGHFLLGMARECSGWNFLGLEIREPLVMSTNEQRDLLGLTNLYFLFCNANASIGPLLGSLPTGLLQRVTIQFPDP